MHSPHSEIEELLSATAASGGGENKRDGKTEKIFNISGARKLSAPNAKTKAKSVFFPSESF